MSANTIQNKTILMLTLAIIVIATGILISTRLTSQKTQKEGGITPYEEKIKLDEQLNVNQNIEDLPKENLTSISIKDYTFSPSTIDVKPGDTITVINNDEVVHTLTSTSGLFDTGDIQPNSFAVITVPQEIGEYTFLCTPHPNMTGKFVVKP